MRWLCAWIELCNHIERIPSSVLGLCRSLRPALYGGDISVADQGKARLGLPKQVFLMSFYPSQELTEGIWPNLFAKYAGLYRRAYLFLAGEYLRRVLISILTEAGGATAPLMICWGVTSLP